MPLNRVLPADVFAPLSIGEFIENHWSRGLLHLQGPAERFSELFPWAVLSETLELRRFSEDRLRLFRSGQTIAAERYLKSNRVVADNLARELAEGATLVLNRCEEEYAPLMDLCDALESIFHQRILTNLYAGWRGDNGFGVHWDDQNNFILQVSGRKQWKVWKPTRMHPLRDDLENALPPRTEEPVWDGVLEQGSFLYIPRGWWHVAFPMEEPSLHLTVTLKTPTGVDLLHWLAERMKSSETVRGDVPVAGSEGARAEWLAKVRADLVAAFDENLIERFGRRGAARNPARPRISLPEDVSRLPEALQKSGPVVIDNRMRLQLVAPLPLGFTRDDGVMVCTAGDSRFSLDPRLGEKMKVFNDRLPHSLEEFGSVSDGSFKVLIGAMVLKGILRRVTI